MKELLAQGATILCIDDEPQILRNLQEGLSPKFREVLVASTIEQAWDLLNTRQIDLVVIDFQMPQINGIEAMHKIHEVYPQMPFLMLTAYIDHPEIKKALRNDAFDVLDKPYDIQILASRILNGLILPRLVRLLFDLYRNSLNEQQLSEFAKLSIQHQAELLYAYSGLLRTKALKGDKVA